MLDSNGLGLLTSVVEETLKIGEVWQSIIHMIGPVPLLLVVKRLDLLSAKCSVTHFEFSFSGNICLILL